MPQSKPDLHLKKLILCVYRNCKGIMYHELFPSNKIMNDEVVPEIRPAERETIEITTTI